MRWKKQKRQKPEIGDERIVYKFMFIPRNLKNSCTGEYESRWMEICRVKQKLIEVTQLIVESKQTNKVPSWICEEWVD